MPNPTGADFDQHARSYREAVEDSIAFSGAPLDFFTRVKSDILLELAGREVGDPRELAFLDLGCGPGETDSFLEGRIGRLAGVDVASEMVEEARRRNPWADYRQYAEGDPLPHGDGSFDVCFAICVFHHVPPGARLGLIEEMKRVCRRDGLIALFEHNPLNPLTRRAVRGCEFDRDAQLLRRRDAERLLAGAGLTPRGRYIEFFPRESGLLRRIEARLGWLPLGAQHVAFAKRP